MTTTEQRPVLVIRHANCPDGAAAAWAVEHGAHVPVEHVAADYGQPPPDVTGREVVIVDFSYPREQLVAMAERAACIHVIDHHKTAIEGLAGLSMPNLQLTLDASRSGARLAWDTFHSPRTPPQALLHVEDRDLWRFAMPETRDVMAAVSSCAMTPDSIGLLMDVPIRSLADQGHAINRFRDQLIAAAVEGHYLTRIDGHDVPVANCPYTVGSDVAGRLAELFSTMPFAAYWFRKGDVIHWGLRSRGEGGADVAAIAAKFGGGGHEHAAGFRVPAT